MEVRTIAGGTVDVAECEILRVAGVVSQARRRTHGGPPKHSFNCRWCDGEVRGRAALDRHERDCSQRPSGDLIEVSEGDMVALAWIPQDTA
jgi:hypothetical protein